MLHILVTYFSFLVYFLINFSVLSILMLYIMIFSSFIFSHASFRKDYSKGDYRHKFEVMSSGGSKFIKTSKYKAQVKFKHIYCVGISGRGIDYNG